MTLNNTNHQLARQTRGIGIIQTVVRGRYKLTEAQLLGRRRTPPFLVEARHVAMSLARVILNASYPDIAAAFNRTNHMSAMHAQRAIYGRMNDVAEGALRKRFRELSRECKKEMAR